MRVMNMLQINPTSTYVQSNLSQSVKNKNETNENTVEKNLPGEMLQNHPRADISVEEIQKGIEKFNKIFKPTHLEFQLHEESGKYFVHIIDDTTKNVVRQIPSEEFLEMVAQAKEQNGIIIDERV
jgi:flagellar protein FlaG